MAKREREVLNDFLNCKIITNRFKGHNYLYQRDINFQE